ncbi:MAG: PDZ domain-containing protein [Myxococcota bacterium]|nr:PDZ domain-containing protein [Myxococcota bacterium]
MHPHLLAFIAITVALYFSTACSHQTVTTSPRSKTPLPINAFTSSPTTTAKPTKSAKKEGLLFGAEVKYLSRSKAKKLGMKKRKGVLVAHVRMWGVASNLGLKEEDVIIKVNRATIRNIRRFNQQMNKLNNDSRLTLTVWRHGKYRKLRAKS